MKTITLITLFVGALAFITNAYASVSGNLQVTSDYLWRGQTQNGNKAAVNGGLDYQGANFYTGVWISSLAGDSDVTAVVPVDSTGGAEANYYIGTDINGFDVGLIKYEFSGTGDAEEGYVGYTLAGFDLAYAQDLDTSDNSFYSISYGLPSVVEGVDASLTYGDVSKVLDENGNSQDYDYLQLDISYGDLTISVVDEDGVGTTSAVSYSWAL